MADPEVFTTRKFALNLGESEFKNSERSLYIKYWGKACGVITRPNPYGTSKIWRIVIWLYPENVDGFDSGRHVEHVLNNWFLSPLAAVKFLKANTQQITTAHNLWLSNSNPWEIKKYGIIKQT